MSYYVQIKSSSGAVLKVHGPFTFEQALDSEWALTHPSTDDDRSIAEGNVQIVEGNPGTLLIETEE